MAGPKTLNLVIYQGEKPYSIDLTFAGYDFTGCTGVAQVKDRSGALLFALAVTFPAADKCRISYADTTPLTPVRGAVWDLFITYSGGVIRPEVRGFVYVLETGETAPKSCDTAVTGTSVTITAAQQGPPGPAGGPQGIPGPQGPQGPQGPAGTAAATPRITTATPPTFTKGQSVFLSSAGVWTLARSDSIGTFGKRLIADVDSAGFSLVLPGQVVDGYSNLDVGKWYHTSATTAGALEPLTGASLQLTGAAGPNQMGQAISPNTILFDPIGAVATSGGGSAPADITFVQADLTAAGILAAVHGLGTSPSAVAVFDELGDQVIPDGWRVTSSNAIAVDVSSFTPITGTWTLSITQ